MIAGSIVELVTPLLAPGAPDYEALESLVDWHAAEGTSALLIGSAASGAGDLDADTRRELLRRAVWQSEGRLPVIADLVTTRIETAIEIAGMAVEAGASALLLTLPATAGRTQGDVLRLVERVAEDATLPLFVRNRFDRPAPPAPTGVASLARLHGVAGYIECSADPSRARELLGNGFANDFRLLCGLDESACRFVLDGFAGVVSVTANVAPGRVSAMIAAARAGVVAGAESIDLSLRSLHEMLLGDAGGAPVRWALAELGRLPERASPTGLSQPHDYAHLRRAMRAAHILG